MPPSSEEDKRAPASEEDKLPPPSDEDKLLKIREEMVLPVGLSELEKERVTGTFDALKVWLDDTKATVLEKPRLEAYKYIELLIAHLQMIEVDYKAGASRASVVKVNTDPIRVEAEESATGELEVPESNIASLPVVRPTVELVDGWLVDMNPQVRSKLTRLLTCFKQYLDPDSEVGIDIICSHCNPAEIAKCLIIADPSIVDSSTVFMEHQLR